ncbi:MAG: hypothetical protein QME07_02570 [bacterium]|nr:hypothetical protein [bacterium]
MKKIVCSLLFGLIAQASVAQEHLIDTSNGSFNLEYMDFHIPEKGIALDLGKKGEKGKGDRNLFLSCEWSG